MFVRVELISEEELARSFRTFTPEPRERNVSASLFVVDGELEVETDNRELERFVRRVIAAAEDDEGRLQLDRTHTSTRVKGGVYLNVHHPGELVPPTDPRYAEGVARALCFVGEHDPSQRFQGKILHAFVDYE